MSKHGNVLGMNNKTTKSFFSSFYYKIHSISTKLPLVCVLGYVDLFNLLL
jgi:hypothetical protein